MEERKIPGLLNGRAVSGFFGRELMCPHCGKTDSTIYIVNDFRGYTLRHAYCGDIVTKPSMASLLNYIEREMEEGRL